MTHDHRTLSHLAREWLRERWSFVLACALLPPSILGLVIHGALSLAFGIVGVVASAVLLALDIRTYLDAEARQVRDRPTRRDERELAASVETHEIDPRRVCLVGESRFRGVPSEIRPGASVPLLIALRCFAIAIAREPGLFDRLLELARQDPRAAHPRVR